MSSKFVRGAILLAVAVVIGASASAVEANTICGRGYIRYVTTQSTYQPEYRGNAPWLAISMSEMPGAYAEYGYYHRSRVIALIQKPSEVFEFDSHSSLLMNLFLSNTPVIIEGRNDKSKACYGYAQDFEIKYCSTAAECGL